MTFRIWFRLLIPTDAGIRWSAWTQYHVEYADRHEALAAEMRLQVAYDGARESVILPHGLEPMGKWVRK